MADRSGFLDRVCAEAHDRVARDRDATPLAELRDRADAMPAPPGFAAALHAPGTSVIAEVKRASPSRGHIADIADPAGLATAYATGGAAAISVLTEPAHFSGDLADLAAVAAAVGVPVIRKDFVVDAYQLVQARAAGAAAALLIVAALEDPQLADLISAADETGLDVLVEAHTAEEAVRAAEAHRRSGVTRTLVLGVNARDLRTLQVDLGHFARVRAEVDLPDGALIVAESGVSGPEDVVRYAGAGADAVLVGEHVASAADPAAAVAALVAATAPTAPAPTP